MNPPHVVERQRLEAEIYAKRTIYQFRTYLYSLDRAARRNTFDLCKAFLENELQDQQLKISQRERIEALLAHFDWTSFDTRAMDWWITLSMNHSRCGTLVDLINKWITGITIVTTHQNISDNESLGLR